MGKAEIKKLVVVKNCMCAAAVYSFSATEILVLITLQAAPQKISESAILLSGLTKDKGVKYKIIGARDNLYFVRFWLFCSNQIVHERPFDADDAYVALKLGVST